MGLEDSESKEEKKLFKEGRVVDLTEDLEILDNKIRGIFLILDPKAGRFVEVKFKAPESEKQLTGYVEKWNSEGDLWVEVQKDPDKSELKHYRLPAKQNISWKLINLNK